MNTSEKKPLLQDESAVKGRSKVRPHSVKGFIILCFVSYFMVQPSGLYSYIINEWTQFTIKQEYLSDPNIQTKTNSCQNLNHSSDRYRNLTRVQQESAKWIMFNHLASYIIGFFVCLVLPPFSDTHGRRFFIILSLSGIILKNVGASIIIYTKQHFIYMVVAYAIEGCTGSSLAFYSVCFSYIADVMKDKDKRVFSIVIFEAILMLSTMVSAIVSGFLIDNLGYANSSFICIGMLLISLVIAIAALPESLNEEHRRSSNSVLMTLKRPFEFYTTDAFKGKRSRYIIFLLAFGFVELSSLNRTTMETIYLLGQPFCFSPTWVGYFSFARHFGETVIGLGSVRLLQIFISNEAIAILSTVCNGTSFVVEAFAASKLMMFMVAVIAIFAFLTIPMIRGIMSTLTPADKQGSMFASLAAIQVLGSIVAVTSENTIYSATVSVMNGFVFLVMAGFCVIEFMLLLIGAILGRRARDTDTESRIDYKTVIINKSAKDSDSVNATETSLKVNDCNNDGKGLSLNISLSSGDKAKILYEESKQ